MEFGMGTKEASRLLGVSLTRLHRAIWDGRLTAPAKGPGGAFFWTTKDLERASWVLLHRPYVPEMELNNAP